MMTATGNVARYDREIKNAQAMITSLQTSLRNGKLTPAERTLINADITTQQGLMNTADTNLQSALQDKAISEHVYMRKNKELTLKKQHMKALQAIDQWVKDMQQLSDDMFAATSATPALPTDTLEEKLKDMSKNLNLLLFPKEVKAATNIDLTSMTEEKKKELFELLKSSLAA